MIISFAVVTLRWALASSCEAFRMMCMWTMHPCVPGIGGKSFHLPWPSRHLIPCMIAIWKKISWQKSLVEKKWNIFKTTILASQRTSYIFALEIGTLHVDRCSGDGGGFFSKGADGLLCSCADDGKLRFFGADVVPQLEPMIVMDGMTLDIDNACLNMSTIGV